MRSVLNPVAGTVVAMSEVPDPVFAQGMVGPGIAVDPGPAAASDACAPIGGVVLSLHPHAFVVVGDDGRGVLVHLGIDTVQLGGEGFVPHVAKGDVVVAGQRVITWSPRAVSDGGRPALVPVVVLELPAEDLEILVPPGETIAAGAPLLAFS
ncbi:PTS glucose transporter subunit IIA [Myceligenerans crystallogenes]|uniref:PTS glucose transporter subunit IIA n=1 Tax=Myceligenerans crystallogenes TaxID=316335 RepID=A0ABN2NC97_9MICO